MKTLLILFIIIILSGCNYTKKGIVIRKDYESWTYYNTSSREDKVKPLIKYKVYFVEFETQDTITLSVSKDNYDIFQLGDTIIKEGLY